MRTVLEHVPVMMDMTEQQPVVLPGGKIKLDENGREVTRTVIVKRKVYKKVVRELKPGELDFTVAPEEVKREAMRRVLAVAPEWKQRNLTAQAVILTNKGKASWTAEERAAWAAGEAIWDHIAAIRAASDVLEAADPIPADFADDKHWPGAT